MAKYRHKIHNQIVDVLCLDPIKEMVTYEVKREAQHPYDEDRIDILEDHFDDFFGSYSILTIPYHSLEFKKFYENEFK